MFDVIARRPDCAGQAADAVSACTQKKGHARIAQNPKSECLDLWIRVPRHKWVQNWECLFRLKTRITLSVNVDVIKTVERKQNSAPMWKNLMKLVDLERTDIFLDHVFLEMHST